LDKVARIVILPGLALLVLGNEGAVTARRR
jgi:hypothetical protein